MFSGDLDGEFPCSLCGQTVSRVGWGEHKVQCAHRNSLLLSRMVREENKLNIKFLDLNFPKETMFLNYIVSS